jgi:hypothetical protein
MISEETLDQIVKILIFFYIAICGLGVLGNILTFIVFSRKNFQNTIFSTYFRFLCICDMITLILRTDYFMLSFTGTGIRSISPLSCKIMLYLIYSIPASSIWILVIISLDRLLSILKPTKFLFRKKAKFQIVITIGTICLILFYNVPVLYSGDLMFNRNQSNQTIKSVECTVAALIDWIDICGSILLPFVIMMILTSVTLSIIFKLRRKTKNSSSKVKTKDIKFAIISISLNLLFFILKFPLGLYYILKNFIQIQKSIQTLFKITLSIMNYSYHGDLFLSNLIVNSIFRREVKLMLKKDTKQRK